MKKKTPKKKVAVVTKAAGPNCRLCGKTLVRGSRSGHRVWFECVNLFCAKNQKQSVTIGGVIVKMKPRG